jgi:hypothetical protein
MSYRQALSLLSLARRRQAENGRRVASAAADGVPPPGPAALAAGPASEQVITH